MTNIVAETSTGITSAAGDSVAQNKLVGNATSMLASGPATFTHNTTMNSNVGIDLGCTSSTAIYNNFLSTGTGFNNVLSSFGTATNGFYSVPTIKGAICQ